MARNSNWSEEEVTLALVLYLSLPFASISARNPKVVEFANLIGRTPGAVSFKLGNLGHCDASLQARGINGLSNISKVDRAVWERYIGNAAERNLSRRSCPMPRKLLSIEILILPFSWERDLNLNRRLQQLRRGSSFKRCAFRSNSFER